MASTVKFIFITALTILVVAGTVLTPIFYKIGKQQHYCRTCGKTNR